MRKAKLKASIDIIEKARAEDQDGISQNGGFLNISDYTQLGEFFKFIYFFKRFKLKLNISSRSLSYNVSHLKLFQSFDNHKC